MPTTPTASWRSRTSTSAASSRRAAEGQDIPGVDETVREGDKVKVGSLIGNVIETPGHTLGHIVYWFHADKIVFVADTLFSVGCGRVIEGTMDQMWDSMLKMRDLPDETTDFLRPRIHRREHQVRAHDRQGQRGRWRARQEAEATGGRRSRRSRPRSAKRRRPIRSCAPTMPSVAASARHGRQAGQRSVRRVRERKNKF